jgi:hypothetical protein
MFELATIDPIRGKEEGTDDDSYIWTDETGEDIINYHPTIIE